MRSSSQHDNWNDKLLASGSLSLAPHPDALLLLCRSIPLYLVWPDLAIGPPMLLDKALPACLRVPLLQAQWRGHKGDCTPLTSGDVLAFLPVASLHSSRWWEPVAHNSAVQRTRGLSTWEAGPLLKLFPQYIFIKGQKSRSLRKAGSKGKRA